MFLFLIDIAMRHAFSFCDATWNHIHTMFVHQDRGELVLTVLAIWRKKNCQNNVTDIIHEVV